MTIEISRYHDISCGHRVFGHESKCVGLHGHNYRITFTAASEKLDSLGRVIDFSVLKSALCEWLELNWDHKFLLWVSDPVLLLMRRHERDSLTRVSGYDVTETRLAMKQLNESLCEVPFNPTAENMAEHLLKTVGPLQLLNTGVYLTKVVVEETRKCSAVASLDQ